MNKLKQDGLKPMYTKEQARRHLPRILSDRLSYMQQGDYPDASRIGIGRRCGLKQQIVSQYFRGRSTPSLEMAMCLEVGLGVAPGWLIEQLIDAIETEGMR